MSDGTPVLGYARDMDAIAYARTVTGIDDVGALIEEARQESFTTVIDFATALRRIADRKASK